MSAFSNKAVVSACGDNYNMSSYDDMPQSMPGRVRVAQLARQSLGGARSREFVSLRDPLRVAKLSRRRCRVNASAEEYRLTQLALRPTVPA